MWRQPKLGERTVGRAVRSELAKHTKRFVEGDYHDVPAILAKRVDRIKTHFVLRVIKYTLEFPNLFSAPLVRGLKTQCNSARVGSSSRLVRNVLRKNADFRMSSSLRSGDVLVNPHRLSHGAKNPVVARTALKCVALIAIFTHHGGSSEYNGRQ